MNIILYDFNGPLSLGSILKYDCKALYITIYSIMVWETDYSNE